MQAVAFAADVQGRAGGEHRIDMRRHRNQLFRCFRAGEHAQHVAHCVYLDVFQPQFDESGAQPLGARALAERRRGNGGHFQLPVAQLGLVGAEPLHGKVDLPQTGQPYDFMLNRCVGVDGGRKRHGWKPQYYNSTLQ